MNIFNIMKNFFTNTQKKFYYKTVLGFYNNKTDEEFLKIFYKANIGEELNLDNPCTFNEKLQWLKLYDRKDIYTSLVDKYEVKKIVGNIIGNQYIIPTIGVWKKAKDIDFTGLPDKFVLKCTHDSGGVLIIKNKNEINENRTKRKLQKLLQKNYYILNREWPYKNVIPRIIAEPLIESKMCRDICDYKFMCFNGKHKCTFVCTGRNNEEGLHVTFYDKEWKIMPFERHYPREYEAIDKPQNYDLMIELAEKLSKNIPFVRADFYEVDGKVYFGEMTFFPGSGIEEFNPSYWDLELGKWINLSVEE